MINIGILNKQFINIIRNHLSYGEILNLYNKNHIYSAIRT